LSDREYELRPPAGARRIAFIGDSVTRGQGAPFGESFEALLELRLNEQRRADGPAQYELINFSTTGYRLTQMLDVALETVPAYDPDVYVICLTRLSVGGAWGDHLAQLIYDGIDLKYPYLRELTTIAGLDPRDPIGAMRAKLEPFRIPVVKWALQEIQRQATSRRAAVVVAFVPTGNRPEALEPGFATIREAVRELDLPLIDLLAAFKDVDLATVRVSAGNVHPNGKGHRIIFEHLYDRIRADPRLLPLMSGPAANDASPGPSGR
jgi:lysophospholipase L1-like esterase